MLGENHSVREQVISKFYELNLQLPPDRLHELGAFIYLKVG